MGAEKFENRKNVDSSMTSWLYRLATAYGTRLHLWSCSNPSPPRDRQTAPPNMKVITGLSRSETISSPTRDRRDAAQVEPDASRQATQNRYPSGSGQPEARRPLLEGSRSPAAPTRRRATRAGATEWRKLREGNRVVAIASAGWLRIANALPNGKNAVCNAAAFAGAAALAVTELLPEGGGGRDGRKGGGEAANGGRLADLASAGWLRIANALPNGKNAV